MAFAGDQIETSSQGDDKQKKKELALLKKQAAFQNPMLLTAQVELPGEECSPRHLVVASKHVWPFTALKVTADVILPTNQLLVTHNTACRCLRGPQSL